MQAAPAAYCERVLMSHAQNVQREQNVLAEKQEELANKQDTVRDKISDNLQQLARERTLIHSGQKQLVNMTDSIKQQLSELNYTNVFKLKYV